MNVETFCFTVCESILPDEVKGELRAIAKAQGVLNTDKDEIVLLSLDGNRQKLEDRLSGMIHQALKTCGSKVAELSER